MHKAEKALFFYKYPGTWAPSRILRIGDPCVIVARKFSGINDIRDEAAREPMCAGAVVFGSCEGPTI
jgi:hypothetical protein